MQTWLTFLIQTLHKILRADPAMKFFCKPCVKNFERDRARVWKSDRDQPDFDFEILRTHCDENIFRTLREILS
jgi:hypothetical protein